MAVGLQQQQPANPELSRFALGLEKKIAGRELEEKAKMMKMWILP